MYDDGTHASFIRRIDYRQGSNSNHYITLMMFIYDTNLFASLLFRQVYFNVIVVVLLVIALPKSFFMGVFVRVQIKHVCANEPITRPQYNSWQYTPAAVGWVVNNTSTFLCLARHNKSPAARANTTAPNINGATVAETLAPAGCLDLAGIVSPHRLMEYSSLT